MTNAKQKNLAAVVAVSLLYIVYLLNHFSAIGAIVTVASITYLVVRNCVTLTGKKYGIIDLVGQYFGASLCNCMLVTLFSTGVNFKGLQFYGLESGIFWAALIITVISVFVLKKLHTESKNNKRLAYIAKYTYLGVGAYFLSKAFVYWVEPTYIYVIIGLIAITVFLEQIHDKYCNNENSNAVFYWSIANVILFAVVEYLYPMQSIEIINKFTNIALIQWKWYTIALITLSMIAVGVFSWILDSEEKVYPNDMKLCLVVGVNMLMIPFALSTYTKYSVVLFIALAVLDIVTFFAKCRGSKYFKYDVFSFGKLDIIFVIGSIVLAILHRGFINGWMYSAAILFAAVLCSILLYRYKAGASGWLFWEFIVIAIGGYASELVYRSYNSPAAYRYIVAVVAVATLVLWIMNVKNSKKYTANIGAKTAVVIFVAIMILFPIKNLGVKYDFKIDNKISQSDPALATATGESNSITIKLKARGKDNSISKCYYYWDADASSAVEVSLNENSEVVIQPQNGTLHMYAEDKYGVSSIIAKNFDFKNLREWKYSGEPIYLGSSIGGEVPVEEVPAE